MNKLKIAALTISIMLAFCTPTPLQAGESETAGSLKPPFNIPIIRTMAGKPDRENFKCSSPPPSLYHLQMKSMYGDLSNNSSIIDPESYNTYIADTTPISLYQKGLNSMANRYVLSNPPRPEIAACVLEWLQAWADDDALLGRANRMGESVRKWALSPIALSYLQIRDDPSLNPRTKRFVESWIRRVSKTVIYDFSHNTNLTSRQNNHLYWAAWAAALSGVVLDDPSMFEWGMEKARFGIDQIDAKGILPLEMARGRMALNYHIFAAMPLVMLANLGQRNGVNLYAENNGGIKRLAKRALRGTQDPSYFVKATGEQQDLSRTLDSSSLAWLEPYNARYPSEIGTMWLSKLRPMNNSRLGGNVTLLFGK